jgi:hypothetical protein
MKLVCYREGRMGYHVGDIVDVPGEPDAFDKTYFRVVQEEVAERDPEPQVDEKTEEED